MDSDICRSRALAKMYNVYNLWRAQTGKMYSESIFYWDFRDLCWKRKKSSLSDAYRVTNGSFGTWKCLPWREISSTCHSLSSILQQGSVFAVTPWAASHCESSLFKQMFRPFQNREEQNRLSVSWLMLHEKKVTAKRKHTGDTDLVISGCTTIVSS